MKSTVAAASVTTTTWTPATAKAVLGQGFFGVVRDHSAGWVAKEAKDTRKGSWQLAEVAKEYDIYCQLQRDTDLLGRVVPDMAQESTPHQLILEYVPGRTLHQIALDHRTTPYVWAQALTHASGMIAAYHAAGWVHGDCHGGNILVSARGARLIDLSHSMPIELAGEREKLDDRIKFLYQLQTLVIKKGLPPWIYDMAVAIIS